LDGARIGAYICTMTELIDTDIFISGGGIAGLTAAAAFGSAQQAFPSSALTRRRP